MWNINTLLPVIYNRELINTSSASLIDNFVALMNDRFPPAVFNDHLEKRRRAIANSVQDKKLLDDAIQSFPDVITYQSLKEKSSFDDLAGFGVVFTAGGEGERLRLSLIDRGVPEESLNDFTKATYPIKINGKGIRDDFGALQINLAMVGWIRRKYGIDIPVIVTTGPKGSITDRVIPDIINKYDNFGINNIMVIPQDERLHFTMDEKIAVQLVGGGGADVDRIVPITHPDETGGPLMKLRMGINTSGINTNDINTNGINTNGINTNDINTDGINTSSINTNGINSACKKLLIAQAPALYAPRLLAYIAAASKGRDCVGVGIPRTSFDASDPFGTFVVINKNGTRALRIIEQGVRNDTTRAIVNPDTGAHLPFNTGLYAVDCKLLEDGALPDYATPPKEILPGVPRSPKVGYAATDVLPLAERPVVLTVDQGMYAVIKSAEDLEVMGGAAERFGLLEAVGAEC